jgi:cytochrome c'
MLITVGLRNMPQSADAPRYYAAGMPTSDGINMSGLLPLATAGRLGLAAVALALTAACSRQGVQTPSEQPANLLEPVASIQELMQAEVDTSADSIWDAVETTATRAGIETKQPRTAQEWQEVRRNAIVLIEAANLLMVDKRKLSTKPFPAEAEGALDSAQIEQRIAANRGAFNQYAVALRQSAQSLLTAIDAQDAKALLDAGGTLDEVCESCHMTFWYPNQKIPPFPSAVSGATVRP